MSVRAPLEDQAESHVCSAQVAVAICKALPAALSLLSSLEFATVVNNNKNNSNKFTRRLRILTLPRLRRGISGRCQSWWRSLCSCCLQLIGSNPKSHLWNHSALLHLEKVIKRFYPCTKDVDRAFFMAKGLDKMRPLAVILDLVVGAPHSDNMRLDFFSPFMLEVSSRGRSLWLCESQLQLCSSSCKSFALTHWSWAPWRSKYWQYGGCEYQMVVHISQILFCQLSAPR